MGLKVWLPLNGDLKNLGTAENTATLPASYNWVATGKIDNQSLYTNTRQANLFFPALTGVSTYTVAYWVYIPSDKTFTSFSDIWGIQFNCNGVNTWERDERRNNASSSITHAYHMAKEAAAGANTNMYASTSDRAASGDAWAHMAVTKNNSTFILYENGIKINSWPASNIETVPRTMTGTIYLGDSGCEAYLQDFRIYDECLSAAQVHEIAKGLILHYKLDGPMGGSGRNLFRNTNFFKTATNSSPASTTISPAITFAENLQNLVGKTITFSFELYTPGARQSNPSQSNATLAERFGAHLSLNYTPSGGSATQLYPCIQYLISTITEPNTRVIQTYTVPSDCTINSFNIAVQPYAYPAADNTATWKIGQFKVEYGDKATSYSPAPEDLGIDTTIVTDSSGYGHHGWQINTQTAASPRYNIATVCNGTTLDTTSSTVTGAAYFFGNLPMPASSALTVTWWGKNDAYGRGGIFETTSTIFTATTGMNGTDYSTTAIANWDSTFRVYNGSSSVNIFSSFIKDGTWHHHAIVFDGTNVYYYCDSNLKTSSALTGTLPAFNGIRMGLGRAGSIYRQIEESVSDLRIYCTPLLDTDIKLLYNVGSRIDNLGGVHTYEINENDTNARSKVLKTGQLQSKNIYEQPALLNNATSASYNPTGANNSTMPRVLWADLSSFYKLGQSIQVQVDVDVSWSNITPTGEGTFFCRIQGAKYEAATNTWVWTGPAIVANNYELTAEMLANPTDSTHVSYISLIPATALEEYTKAAFGIRTDYATGTISFSNLKITLIPGTAKINSNYVSGTEIIEM